MDDLFGLTFARPDALWLLLAAPLFALAAMLFSARKDDLSRLVIMLRVVIVALLVVTLAEPLTTTGAGAVSTVFVVDRSGSITDQTSSQINTWIEEALEDAGTSDRAAVINFGSEPILSEPAAPADDLGSAWSDSPAALDPDYTDLESAVALGRALPLGGSRRIVVVSDGAENIGSALNQAGQAASDGTPIDVVPVEGVGESDLRVAGVTAPNAVWVGQSIAVVVSIASSATGSGVVELWVDGEKEGEQAASFQAGLSSYTFQVDHLSPGFHALEARVSGDNDRFPENNVAPLALVVRDQPQLLLVAPAGTDVELLRGALERADAPDQGAEVTWIEPQDLPFRLSELAVYDAIILNNVPEGALTHDQQVGLQEVTRTYGRGLVVVGGRQSYGPGGYAGSVLEETLPVTVKVTDGRERQRIALLIIFDKSGSMSYDPLGGTSKIEMAKEAARLAVSSVAEGDQIGILAFNDQQHWVVQMTTVEGQASRDQINAAIEGVTSDGGTEIFPALSVGYDAIRRVEADVRHIVLLSDGKSRTGTRESYQSLIADSIGDRTTLSTIAIGDDSDTDLLQFLAEQGGGRYHFTEKAEDIPRLTMYEAQSAGSQSVIVGSFQPIQQDPSPIMIGFDPRQLPSLDGYDYAEAKPDAQIVLTSTRDDPVLAKWQYGLGRVVAWTADDGSDFAQTWPTWENFAAFWSSMVRWTLPDPENRPLQVTTTRDGPEIVITVTATGEAGDYVDHAATTAAIVAPDGTRQENLGLVQVGPGEYELRYTPPGPGSYQIELSQMRGAVPVAELAGFAVPPSPELQPSADAMPLLEALADRTGGRVLSLDEPGAAFDGVGLRGSALRDYDPVWFVPLSAALLLLLAEIAIRLRFLPRLQDFAHRRAAA
ncbi:MAG: VWA domain-containing protein [Thermomicrobiales bacterium]